MYLLLLEALVIFYLFKQLVNCLVRACIRIDKLFVKPLYFFRKKNASINCKLGVSCFKMTRLGSRDLIGRLQLDLVQLILWIQ